MSDPSSPEVNPQPDEEADQHVAAVAALRHAFTRLQPQGSDQWNFLAAFTHLGDRYGPYQPGASALSKELGPERPAERGRAEKWRRRLQPDPEAESASQPSELESAMGQVVEAFRFLAARVRTLEERMADEDRPLDGMPWLLPAQELGEWVAPLTEHIAAVTPGGEVLHGDCGEGDLLRSLEEAGVPARGAEPRGMVGLTALERGRSVALVEVADELAACPPSSLGGLVLSGVVDRLPLHSVVSLLRQARIALALGAPIVVVAGDPENSATRGSSVARDVAGAQPLHAATWEILLDRAGFVAVAALEGGREGDGRFAIGAAAPR